MAASDATPDNDVKDALEVFSVCEEVHQENRRLALGDIKFVDLLLQWPEKVRRARELDGRPCLTIDKLGPVIRQVVNDARQNKPGITVHPVDDGSDLETAEIFSGLIRNIEVSSDSEVAYDTALAFAAKGGFGYFRINTQYANDDTFDQDIVIERIADPFSVWGDPYSTAADSSDWNTTFVIDQMPKKLFERRWKGAEAVDWKMGDYARMPDPWMNGDLVAVAEYWSREEVEGKIVLLAMEEAADALQDPTRAEALLQLSKVVPSSQIVDIKVYEANQALFDLLQIPIVGQPRTVKRLKVTQKLMTGVEVLETNDWAGKYIPIVPVYGEEAWVEGRRHLRGIVRAAQDAQRNFNYWRTTATELVALAPKAPFIGPKGSFETDAAKWATANTTPHAYIEYDPVMGEGSPQRQPFAGIPAGALQEAANSSDDIKAITGIYDASLGARSNETSGRAIMARQREGDVSTFHYIDNLSRAIRHAGRILVDLIPKVYSAPRVVRILGLDGKPENKKVNQPVTVKEKGEDGEIREVERIYRLDAGKYDVTVTAGPSYTTQREEAASQMIELIRAYPAAAPVIGDLLAKNLDWPGADEIAERLQALLPPQLRGEDPQAQAAQEQMAKLAEALKAAGEKVKELQTDRELEERKLDIQAFDAETKRLTATQDAMGPEQVAMIAAQTVYQLLSSPDVLEPEAETSSEGAEYGAPPPMAAEPPMQPPIQPPAPPMMGDGEDD